MVIIMIRRFVRADREEKFLETYRAQKPTTNPAFKGETLTKVNADVPLGLRGVGAERPRMRNLPQHRQVGLVGSVRPAVRYIWNRL